MTDPVADRRRRRGIFSVHEDLADKPDSALVEYLRIPEPFVSPGQRIARRLLYALGALFAAVLIVYIDRDGYRDVTEEPLSFLDCVTTPPCRCRPPATAISPRSRNAPA